MRFILNEEKFDALCALRGWKFPPTDLAKATGYTRSFARRVLLGEEKLNENFMLRYIEAAGVNPNKPHEWGSLFIPVLSEDEPHNHPKWNFPKLEGKLPYSPLSNSFEFRKRDNPDLEELPIKSLY